MPLSSMLSPPLCTQMDDRRLAVGCGNGTVQLVDLRRTAGGGSAAAKVGAGTTKLQACTVLPAHRERVSWAQCAGRASAGSPRVGGACLRSYASCLAAGLP